MSNNKFEDDERFDGLYMNVAQTTRGIEPLLDTVFSFLRRKTDFFAGPPGSDDGMAAAVEKVNQVMMKHAKRYEAEHTKKNSSTKKSTTTTKSTKQKTSKSSTSTSTPIPASKKTTKVEEEEVIEMGNDGGFDISSAEASSSSTTPKDSTKQQSEEEKPAPAEKESTKTKPDDEKQKKDAEIKNETDSKKKDDDTDEKPPLGNGGTVPGKYVWTQTLAELAVNIPLPDNTRGKDLNVTIARKHLKVGLRAQKGTWIVDAPLTKTIIVDDSFWTVEDGNRLVINMQKSNQMEWWDSICQGDPTINIQKIQPENSNLSDLDGETRKTVEKMMFDQRQKALGLPTSEESSKLEALERFKKQHPEMDFSNAKIS